MWAASWWNRLSGVGFSRARATVLVVLAALVALHCAPVAAPHAPAQCVEPATAAPHSVTAAAAPEGAPYAATPTIKPVAAAPQLRVVPQVGPVGKISQVAYSLDGRYLISGSDDIKLWDPPTGLMLGTLQIPGDKLLGFALHPDGKRLVSGSFDGQVTLWSIEDAAQLASWQVPGVDYCSQLDVSDDGQRILAGCRGGAAVLDLAKGQIVEQLDTHGEPAQAAAFTPDGPVVVLDRRGKLQVWDVAHKKQRFTVSTIADPGEVRFDARGTRMIVGLGGSVAGGYALAKQQQHEVHLYDTKHGRLLQALKGLEREISDADLSTDGARLAVISYQRLSVFDLKAGAIQRTLPIYPRSPLSVAFHPGGRELTVGGQPMNSTPPALVTYDAESLKATQTFEGTRWQPAGVAFNGDGTRALIGSHDEEVTLWNTETGAVLASYRGSDDWNLMDVALADDGVRGVAGSPTKAVFWDLSNGKQRGMRLGTLWTYVVGITPDAKRAVGCGYGSVMKVWDYASGRTISTVKVGDDNSAQLSGCAITPDGKRALYVFQGEKARLIDADSGAQIHEYDKFGGITRLRVSRDGQLMLSIGQRLGLWRVNERSPLRTLDQQAKGLKDAALTPDNQLVVSVDGSSVVTVRDANTGVVTRQLHASSGQLTRITAAPDGRRLLAASQDGTARLFDLASGRSLALVSSGREWLMFDDEGYFDASQRGGELVALVHKGRPFRIDQLAMRFNDPGRMLAKMGLGAGGVHEQFSAWYRRRLRRLNVSEQSVESAFAGAPEAEILQLEATPDGQTARIAFELRAGGSGLSGYQLYVNDVPLFGLAGHPLQGPANGVVRGEERIALTPGVNRVELSALGGDGIQSFRVLRKVQSAAAPPRDLYVLAFGVSHYANSAYNLGYAHKDALDLVDVAKTMAGPGKGFRAVHAQAFIDEQVTVAQLRNAKQQLANARPNDVVLVFVAGHGMYSRDADARYFYLTHEVDLKRLKETAAPFELVEDLVQEIAPRQKLLLIDTCTSGERDDDDDEASSSALAPRAKSRGIRALVLARPGASAPARRRYLLERDRFIYNDLLRRSGAIVLSSSRGTESSFEDESIQNGYFTEQILRAFTGDVADRNHDGLVSPPELSSYVQSAVSAATNGAQHPTVDHNNTVVDFGFPVMRSAAPIAARAVASLAPRPPQERGLELADAAASSPTSCVPSTPPPHACGCRAAGLDQRGPGGLLSGAAWAAYALCLVRARARRQKI